ncbi:hypothetical protein SAMN04488523_104287 [Sulfitobacter brevis]|uniref:Acetyl-CoA acetyltransferase n=1 Tax=Sulfitobacter brevis TaxID=74348 RepID=A0A1I1XBB2_9RHOB|nr:acetyl-CoA acetyltransferase [Sulfitobacter brevis]SFE03938.1 hypothetical protein SAMN04488523_104287 [Sulfitobacter brevis]
MAESKHPFHGVAALAKKRGAPDLQIKVEHDGDYVRLYHTDPALFFKHRDDPSDPFDREFFGKHKRILLSAEDCAGDHEYTLALIESLLEKFADYKFQRS